MGGCVGEEGQVVRAGSAGGEGGEVGAGGG